MMKTIFIMRMLMRIMMKGRRMRMMMMKRRKRMNTLSYFQILGFNVQITIKSTIDHSTVEKAPQNLYQKSFFDFHVWSYLVITSDIFVIYFWYICFDLDLNRETAMVSNPQPPSRTVMMKNKIFTWGRLPCCWTWIWIVWFSWVEGHFWRSFKILPFLI